MRHKEGITTLTALLVIASILLSGGIALHTSLRNTLVVSVENAQAHSARSLALSCVYEGWYQLIQNQSYTGESLTLDTGICTLSVTKQTNTYMITSEGHTGEYFSTYVLTLELLQKTFTPKKLTHSN